MSLIIPSEYPSFAYTDSSHSLRNIFKTLLTHQILYRPEQGLALLDTAEEHEQDSELTFLVHVWGIFLSVKDTRHVKTTVAGELEDKKEAIRWIETAWEKDQLKCNWGTEFVRGCIPELKNLDPYMQIYTDHAPRVKNPKPDLAYGLKHKDLSDEEQHINKDHGANLSPYLDHPFFIVEVKNAENGLYEAENQCARGGAAMVRLKRKFNMLAEGTFEDYESQQLKDKDGNALANRNSHNKEKIPIDHYRADAKSFAFSLAIHPSDATMLVHWAEEAFDKEGTLLTVNWHASYIAHYWLKEEGPWMELHHDIDNILDWGVLARRQELKELCSRIFEREQKEKGKKKQKI